MNIKKGLTRIFILGMVIAPIAGFFSSADRSMQIASSDYDTRSRIKEQIKTEPCASIVKSNPKEFPKLNPSYTCSPTYIYWDGIRKWQAENGRAGQMIDDDTVDQALRAETNSQQWEVRWVQIAIYAIGYLFIWLVGLIIFYLGRWIYRGFKSQ
jgi:hypothetical protein